MSKDQDESVLVLLVQSGAMAAFERLLARLYQPMRSYVFKMVGAAMADDVLQEIALRIYQQVRFLREPRAFRPWVYRIATRIAFVHLKRDKRWRKWENDSEPVVNASQPEFESELLSMVDLVRWPARAI